MRCEGVAAPWTGWWGPSRYIYISTLHTSTIISTISTHQGLPQEEGPSHHRQLRLQAPLPRHLRGHARLHDARHRQVYLIYISTLISTTLSTQAVYRRPDQLYRGRSAGRHTGPLLLDTLHLQRARQVRPSNSLQIFSCIFTNIFARLQISPCCIGGAW